LVRSATFRFAAPSPRTAARSKPPREIARTVPYMHDGSLVTLEGARQIQCSHGSPARPSIRSYST
jgi:cytochrome c peroxidase